jgi:hypothetical protein
MNRDSSVGIETGYVLDGRRVGIQVPVGSRFVSSPQRLDRLWGPSSLLFNGHQGIFSPGGRTTGREADHLPPSSAEVKNDGAIPPLRHMPSWRGASLAKHSDKFTFYSDIVQKRQALGSAENRTQNISFGHPSLYIGPI